MAGKIGDVEVKRALAKSVNEFLGPIRERRAYYAQHMDLVEDALLDGTRRARVVAAETMTMVREAMRISSYTKTWR